MRTLPEMRIRSWRLCLAGAVGAVAAVGCHADSDLTPVGDADDSGDAADAGAGEDAPLDLPGADASCDELAAYVRWYALAHDDCEADDECESAVAFGGITCQTTWVRFGIETGSDQVLGVRRDAADPVFRDLRGRLARCCYTPFYGGGEGRGCGGVWDAPHVGLSAGCSSGLCLGHVWIGPESCI